MKHLDSLLAIDRLLTCGASVELNENGWLVSIPRDRKSPRFFPKGEYPSLAVFAAELTYAAAVARYAESVARRA
jgi:hypothetical protein